MNLLLIEVTSIFFYLMAASSQGFSLFGFKSSPKWLWFLLGSFALIGHAFLLYHWIDITSGQNLTYVNVFTLIAWIIGLLVLFSALYKPTENISIFIFPVTAVSIMLAIYLPGQHIEETATNPKEFIHIWIAVLAFSVLSIAGVQAFLLATQEYCLRQKRFNLFLQSLPPLETMEMLLFQMILLGFILLSLMLATSMAFFRNIFAPPLLHQTVLSLTAWLVFALLLWGRYYFGWRGKIAIYSTLAGVILLIISYFGTALL